MVLAMLNVTKGVKYINVIEINRMPTQKITVSFIIVSLNIVTGWVNIVA